MIHAKQVRCCWTLKRLLLFLIVLHSWISTQGQEPGSYSILVAGHAYGAHAGTNIGLHPPFLNKLVENKDTVAEMLFLTGDIVNRSTTASWAQVEKELSELGMKSCYVMGNHDNNTIGYGVFNAKHGGAYYSLTLYDDLYIVLNSTESDRSISNTQLSFLSNTLKNALSSNKRVFVFFHEVLWNSHDKYRFVRSNSRSRYNEIKSISNFWSEVVPILDSYPERKFYLFAGDVGGNPDAIAASYDRWGQMTLISSGMGEVPDENYLKMDINPDTVLFTLKPLKSEVDMKPITWYNIPLKPQKIDGPAVVESPALAVRYLASPVFNATSYRWSLSNGITGRSDSASADLAFVNDFQTGQIMVRAVNDGFGESEPIILDVKSYSYTPVSEINAGNTLSISQSSGEMLVRFSSSDKINARLKVYNSVGKLLYNHPLMLKSGLNSHSIHKQLLGKGLVIVECSFENKRLNHKIVLY